MEIVGDVQVRKEKLVSEIEVVQDSLEHNQKDDLLNKEEALLKEFDVVLEQEEMIWLQKSREKRIDEGDRNTKFFHTSTIIRRRRNGIDMLKNDEGQWISNAHDLKKLAIEYYKRLYSLDDVDPVVNLLLRIGFVSLSREDHSALIQSFSSRGRASDTQYGKV